MYSLTPKLEAEVKCMLEPFNMQRVLEAAYATFTDPDMKGGISETYLLSMKGMQDVLPSLIKQLGTGLYKEPELQDWQTRYKQATNAVKSEMDKYAKIRFSSLANVLEDAVSLSDTCSLMFLLKDKYQLTEIPASLNDVMRIDAWSVPVEPTQEGCLPTRLLSYQVRGGVGELLFLMHVNRYDICIQPDRLLILKHEKKHLAKFAWLLRSVLRDITGSDNLQAFTNDARMSALLEAALSMYDEPDLLWYTMDELAREPKLRFTPVGAAADWYMQVFRSRFIHVLKPIWLKSVTASGQIAEPATALHEAAALLGEALRLSLGAGRHLLSKKKPSKKPSLDARASYSSAAPMARAPMPRASGGAQLQRALAGMRVSAGAPQCPPRAPRCSGGALQPRASAGAAVKSVLGPSYVHC